MAELDNKPGGGPIERRAAQDTQPVPDALPQLQAAGVRPALPSERGSAADAGAEPVTAALRRPALPGEKRVEDAPVAAVAPGRDATDGRAGAEALEKGVEKMAVPGPDGSGVTRPLDPSLPKKAEEAWRRDNRRAVKGAGETAGAGIPSKESKATRDKNPAEPAKSAAAPLAAAPKEDAERRGWFHKMLAGLGQLLYTLGFAAELQLVHIGRFFRNGGFFIAQVASWAATRVVAWVSAMARGVWQDLTAPLTELRRAATEREDEEEEAGGTGATLFGRPVKPRVRFVVQVAGILLPIAATVGMVLTIFNVTNMTYGLAVEHNGEVLGYVADQSVVESAKELLRGRIRLASNQDMADWQLNPTYTIARTSEFTTTQQLVNEILLSAQEETGDLIQATGLYINGELFSVTTEGERLREYLDGVLVAQEDPERPDAVVDFVQQVECDPTLDDVFFTSSVEEYDVLISRLEEYTVDQQVYRATGSETVADIAHANELELTLFLGRNPDLYTQQQAAAEEADEDEVGDISEYVPPEGTLLLLRRPVPFLQVQVRSREMHTEELPYTVYEVETDERPKGARFTTQEGSAGVQEVWYDYVYIDGELVRTEPVPEMTVVLAAPVDEIIEIGTKEPDILPGMPSSGMGGSYIFPVPGSPYSSRGFSGGHRGLDINAPAGTPIYAAQGGVVVTAGWHYSWGYHIVIDHPGGVQTLYAHCSALYVVAGQQVAQGTHIGAVGSTGNSSGNHCHLEVTVNGQLVDPTNFVGYPY